MTERKRLLRASSVSILTLNAVLMLGQSIANACEATANTTTVSTDVTTNSISVTCDAPDTNLLFGTDHFGSTGGLTYFDYDGNGDDTITIRGGTISNAGSFTPEIDNLFSGAELNSQSVDIVTWGGNDVVDISGGTIIGGLQTGDDNDQVRMTGGSLGGTLDGGADNDTFDISGTAVIAGAVLGNGGDDLIFVSGGAIGGSVFGDGDIGFGNDTISVSGGTIFGSVFAGDGADSVAVSGGAQIGNVGVDSVGLEEGDDGFVMTGGFLSGAVSGGDGNDSIAISAGTVSDFVAGNDGDDSVFISGTAVIGAHVTMEDGNDTLGVSGGTIGGFLDGGTGDDVIGVSGGTIGGGIFAGTGNDTVQIAGGSLGDGIMLEDGDDTIAVSDGTIAAGISAGAGNDTIIIAGGSIGFNPPAAFPDFTGVGGDDGDDVITMTGGTVAGYVGGDDGFDVTGDGNDTINISGGTIGGGVVGNGGNDTINISGGTIALSVNGLEGDDTINISGGTINGGVGGDSGFDSVTVSGGTIAGGIDAESVTLTGGTIGGDITGISSDTLVIAAGSGLTLQNGVLFSGTNAVGTISGTDLARASGSTFQSQNFSGFSSLSVSNSTLGFASGSQIIDNLSLTNGSVLYASGAVSLLSQSGGGGNFSLSSATLNMINGVTTDTFNVGNLTFNSATLAIDADQQNLDADSLTYSGTFSAAGSNIIYVNLIGTPQFAGTTLIPISPVTGETVDDTAAGSALYTVQGIDATTGSLFSYDVVVGSQGGLYLRTTAQNFASPQATRVAIDAQPIETVSASVDDITDDAIATELGLIVSSSRSDAAPSFGIYATGQYASVSHDGFSVSNDNFFGLGPSFSAHDFSVAASVELDAAKYWGFDDVYGLNVGLFGGYASSDVSIDQSATFASAGNADNKSGMIGGYGLFRSGVDYGLVSVTSFLGNTDINNYVLSSTGEYDTVGYAVTGTVGHIFALSDRYRFDLRGGLLGVNFEGDEFVDSEGNNFGKSRISFGAFKFEPGVYGEFRLENGWVASPYARAEFQQRFGYRNTGSIDGIRFDFDDSDFSAAFSAGVNVQVSAMSTLSTEARTKLSSDSSTFAGKFGWKVKF